MKFLAAFALAITAVMAVATDAKCAQVGEMCNPKASPPVECCNADCAVLEGQTGFVWLPCPFNYPFVID